MILIDNACSSLQGLWVCSVSRVIPDGEQTNTKGEDKGRILHKILETSWLKVSFFTPKIFNDLSFIAIIAISIDLLQGGNFQSPFSRLGGSVRGSLRCSVLLWWYMYNMFLLDPSPVLRQSLRITSLVSITTTVYKTPFLVVHFLNFWVWNSLLSHLPPNYAKIATSFLVQPAVNENFLLKRNEFQKFVLGMLGCGLKC